MAFGSFDVLQKTGKVDSLLRSGIRFSEKLSILTASSKVSVEGKSEGESR